MDLASFSGMADLLIDVQELEQQNKSNAKIGKLLTEEELKKRVRAKGVLFWEEVRQFARSHSKGPLLRRDKNALDVVIRGKAPDGACCRNLQRIVDSCRENGFQGEL